MTRPRLATSVRSTSSSAWSARAAGTTTRRTRNSRSKGASHLMAIETQPESAQAPGGGDPGTTPKQRNFWLSPGIHTAVIGAVIGYIFGHWLGNFIYSQAPQVPFSDDNDFAIVLGFSFLILGWLIGLGVFDDL